jgi:hypothetical protein
MEAPLEGLLGTGAFIAEILAIVKKMRINNANRFIIKKLVIKGKLNLLCYIVSRKN